jgi:hypothetical protein
MNNCEQVTDDKSPGKSTACTIIIALKIVVLLTYTSLGLG